MKITAIELSVFASRSNTPLFDLEEVEHGAQRRWVRRHHQSAQDSIHVLHVHTDTGLEGVCTVGDARYTTMRQRDLEQLRVLALGQNPFDREYLFAKLHAATRGLFTRPGWFGAFDNCLWDIAGKAANLPVSALIGRARTSCPAYYNFGGANHQACADDALQAIEHGFVAVKDHFHDRADANIAGFAVIRRAVGDNIDILHDAASTSYSLQEALRVGRALEELRYGWFEEALPDRNQTELQHLCAALDIPVLAPETLMHDIDLSAEWLTSGATDYLRANARHGTTALLKLAHLAELHRARIELNGPGGLFGLIHAHLVCCLPNTSYYEYFPNGSRDEAGREIGLTNPPLPQKGRIAPPEGPGWGAEWDWDYFRKTRVAVL
ncbi:MAG: hypothetical protein GKR89_00250 [Candidatus Latescibacteria bacterium]|nr:hypothetical protein [Candidatus Latescibacterota bacterium]